MVGSGKQICELFENNVIGISNVNGASLIVGSTFSVLFINCVNNSIM